MYGYDPERHERSDTGGCGDIFLLTRVAAEVLLPPMLIIMGTAGLIMTAFFLAPVNPPLALLALLPVAVLVGFFIRRDRRAQREREDDALGRPRR